MSGISETISDTKNRVIGYTDDLSRALDFGINAGPNEPIKAENPEKDITEIDRANPVNVEFAPLGVHRYIWMGAGLVIGLIVLKRIKVI